MNREAPGLTWFPEGAVSSSSSPILSRCDSFCWIGITMGNMACTILNKALVYITNYVFLLVLLTFWSCQQSCICLFLCHLFLLSKLDLSRYLCSCQNKSTGKLGINRRLRTYFIIPTYSLSSLDIWCESLMDNLTTAPVSRIFGHGNSYKAIVLSV